MKPGPVTKLERRKKTIFKKSDDDLMSANCDVIVIFPIYGQFGAIWKPGSGSTVSETFYLKLPFVLQKLKTELENL